MLNVLDLNLQKATFISERNSRFICDISYKGKIIECYVPITCKISKLISLAGKEVLITSTTNAAKRIKYTLFAVKNGNEYIIVNAAFANNIVRNLLTKSRNRDAFCSEQFIESYKCDFFSKQSNTLIEVKSAITTEKILVLPNMKSERTVRQLKTICNLLSKGYNAEYFVVAFAPQIEKVAFDSKKDTGKLLIDIKNLGAKITCLKVTLTELYEIRIDELDYEFK